MHIQLVNIISYSFRFDLRDFNVFLKAKNFTFAPNMSQRKTRVRFAPSPTGALHLGGVRTVLYNYLFTKQQGGDFVLRIEDTDQSRFVPGAEDYIVACLKWCGLEPDESPEKPGEYGPYRQSERKAMYRQYALQLVEQGQAYIAFDTAEELEKMREQYKGVGYSAQYDKRTRMYMRNSLSLPKETVEQLLAANAPHVIRIKMPENETVVFQDLIRGEVQFDTNLVDDKVLLKADGMPTYHLAVVVDDYFMQISHAFRGEEWLPSAPVHLLLWKYLGWEAQMPQWAHLPLILKPDGNGKLSKRDGERLGFPVFAMDWQDPKTGEKSNGFKEIGFLPEAFINMLALLGWNPGLEQELFTLQELTTHFSIERIHKGGAKFDFEKAKWFNHQYIQKADNTYLAQALQDFIPIEHRNHIARPLLEQVIGLVKERLYLLKDFWEQASFFFVRPLQWDTASLKSKWNEKTNHFFEQYLQLLAQTDTWTVSDLEHQFLDLMQRHELKKGEVLLPLRIMLVGAKFGPDVFAIEQSLGKEESIWRIKNTLNLLAS